MRRGYWLLRGLPMMGVHRVVLSGLITGAVIGLTVELALASMVPATSQLDLIASLAHRLFAEVL